MAYITTYNPQPVTFTHGEGVYLYDKNNKAYLDALSGIAVTGLGHNHPEITKTICEQAGKLLHTSNVYHIENQEKLAEKLCKLSGMSQVFFTNSGAESNETAIKVARLYGHSKGIETPSIIVMEKAFHGRTMACLTASAGRKGQAGFEPLVPGFVRAPYNDIESLETISQNRNDVVAILVEPIQGEGGINRPQIDYLNQLREICDQKGWLLMLDEIQTGVGRTGEYYAYQHNDIIPDVLTTAKALGNGIPIGACLMSGPACDLLEPGKHGSTFGGNPFATRVALKVLEIIEEQKLCDNASARGEELMHGLILKLVNMPQVKSIRSMGLMIGIELDKPCREIIKIGLEEGLLFNVTQENTIRLLPPLIINEEQTKQVIEKMSLIIERFYQ